MGRKKRCERTVKLLVDGLDDLVGDTTSDGENRTGLCGIRTQNQLCSKEEGRGKKGEETTHHVERVSNVRSRTDQQQHSEVNRAPNDRNELVPSKENQHSIDPHRDLSPTRDHTPLRLEVVRVALLPESGDEGGLGGGSEEGEGVGEGEVGVLGGGGGVDGGGRGRVGRVGEGEGIRGVDGGDSSVEGDEGENLCEHKRFKISSSPLVSTARGKNRWRNGNARSPSPS
jgi:hypothetical protein